MFSDYHNLKKKSDYMLHFWLVLLRKYKLIPPSATPTYTTPLLSLGKEKDQAKMVRIVTKMMVVIMVMVVMVVMMTRTRPRWWELWHHSFDDNALMVVISMTRMGRTNPLVAIASIFLKLQLGSQDTGWGELVGRELLLLFGFTSRTETLVDLVFVIGSTSRTDNNKHFGFNILLLAANTFGSFKMTKNVGSYFTL